MPKKLSTGYSVHFPTGEPRFPAPRSVEDIGACFVVKDDGKSSPTFYYEEEPGRRSAAKLLTKDEARRDCC